jgi:hypothetical protein
LLSDTVYVSTAPPSGRLLNSKPGPCIAVKFALIVYSDSGFTGSGHSVVFSDVTRHDVVTYVWLEPSVLVTTTLATTLDVRLAVTIETDRHS